MRGIPSPIAACRAAPMTPTPSPDLSLAAAWRGLMAACGPTLAYLVLALWALLLALMPAAVVLAAAAGGAVLVALASPPAAAAAMAVGFAPADDSVSTLQWALAAVAAGNFLLSLATWYSGRHKAAAAELEAFKNAVREQFGQQARQLAVLESDGENAIGHEHLAEVYRDIKAIAAQINTLAGQQQQMNDNLRLLLARVVQV